MEIPSEIIDCADNDNNLYLEDESMLCVPLNIVKEYFNNQVKKERKLEKKILYDKALKLWGEDSQINMVIEEACELIDAIMKFRRGRIPANQIIGEIADLEIVLEQLKQIGNWEKYTEELKLEKLKRLEKRIEEYEKNLSDSKLPNSN